MPEIMQIGECLSTMQIGTEHASCTGVVAHNTIVPDVESYTYVIDDSGNGAIDDENRTIIHIG